jgi:hypothetical protein
VHHTKAWPVEQTSDGTYPPPYAHGQRADPPLAPSASTTPIPIASFDGSKSLRSLTEAPC